MRHIEVALDTIPFDTPHRVEGDKDAIVVIRTREGIHAFRDRCPHAGWRLSDGRIVDGTLECPGHGWQFELATGLCGEVRAYCLKPVGVTVLGDKVRFEWAECGWPAVATWIGLLFNIDRWLDVGPWSDFLPNLSSLASLSLF